MSRRRSLRRWQILLLAALLAGRVRVRAAEPFSPHPPPRPVVLLDYYHRTAKGTRIGQHLLTGSYRDTVGRYRTDDFSHTNSYDSLLNALEKDFELHVQETPLLAKNLGGADIIVLINPEKPTPDAPVPVLSDAEIADLIAFVERGGTVVALLNSVGVAGTEEFETRQMRKVARAFGVDWNDVNTEYSDITVGPRHGYFYDIPTFHYGAGCTLRFLAGAQQPEVLLNVKEDNGASEVRGPGIVLTRRGRGKFLCVGDTGSWGGGNMSRPWAENRKFLLELFGYARASREVAPPQPPLRQPLRYQMQVGLLNVIPTGNPLAAVPQPEMETYTPRPRTGIPFMEVDGLIEVEQMAVNPDGTHAFEIRLPEWRRAGKPRALAPDEKIAVQTTRQGSLVEVAAHGDDAAWLASTVDGLFAFIPNDAVRIGDRWRKIFPLRVNPLRGIAPAITKPVEMETIYLRDETFAGHDCRVFRTQAEVWLPEAGASVEDVVPVDRAHEWGGQNFELMAGRGGRILHKREQWIDARSGIVIKAETQTRLLAWIHRKDEPLPLKTVQKDDRMMVSLATSVSFVLQE